MINCFSIPKLMDWMGTLMHFYSFNFYFVQRLSSFQSSLSLLGTFRALRLVNPVQFGYLAGSLIGQTLQPSTKARLAIGYTVQMYRNWITVHMYSR